MAIVSAGQVQASALKISAAIAGSATADIDAALPVMTADVAAPVTQHLDSHCLNREELRAIACDVRPRVHCAIVISRFGGRVGP